MAEASPSVTARRVAAYRLSFERAPAPYGDPDADDALAADVAAGEVVDVEAPMGRYLRGRTAFFDRMVVGAIEGGIAQLVSIGAGYDGRAIRYHKAGLRWWEVDRPGTQADKRRRLARLGVDAGHIGFVAHDLADGGLPDALTAAGFTPDDPALFLLEGVAVYLDPGVLTALFGELRSVAARGAGWPCPSGRCRPRPTTLVGAFASRRRWPGWGSRPATRSPPMKPRRCWPTPAGGAATVLNVPPAPASSWSHLSLHRRARRVSALSPSRSGGGGPGGTDGGGYVSPIGVGPLRRQRLLGLPNRRSGSCGPRRTRPGAGWGARHPG